jgi:heat shock protein HslJ
VTAAPEVFRRCLILACVASLVTGCDSSTSTGSDNPLAGTSWRLVEFQSMDDAQGTTRPEDPALYTMTLNADGTVAMQLNCNRASGAWSAVPSADGDSGSIEFGPLAMTRAFCPPPSMDQSIAAQTGYIRSYLLRDGRLYLSLFADGGIYVWEPEAAVE